VPSSGVLPTAEHRGIVTLPFKWSQETQTAKKAAPVAMRRYVAHSHSTAGRKTVKRITTAHQGIAASPPIVSSSVEQPSEDGTGYEPLLAQLGKGKVSK
jgi:hypothetical protein